ncbi:MAG: TetR/AcrR family transcriptional regulator [Longimicrobiales bacterium]|nr:TetR/AcrR family transcriptional regulator [Longimicrobiales bacterium]
MSEQRDRILEHACELFLAQGADGFSMRRLARSLGVTAPALYKHYESREQLLQDVLVQAYQRFAQYLYRGLAGGTPLERLSLASEGYLDFALENPRLYGFMFADPDTLGMARQAPEVEALGCAIGQFWHDRVRECMDEGLLRPGDPEDVSVTLWGHAHGLLILFLRGRLLREGAPLDRDGFRRFFEASGRRMLEGVGTPALLEILDGRPEAAMGGVER